MLRKLWIFALASMVCSCEITENINYLNEIPTYDLREKIENVKNIYLGRFGGVVSSYITFPQTNTTGPAEYDGSRFNIWITKNEEMKCYVDQEVTGCDNASIGILSADLQFMISGGPIADGTANISLFGNPICVSSLYTMENYFDGKYSIMVDNESLTDSDKNCEYKEIKYFYWQFHRTTKQSPPPSELLLNIDEHVT
jgi:hypothetical protein